jgi:hypothetical protein
MSSFRSKLPSLTIPTGQAVSNVLPGWTFQDAIALQVYSPSALEAGSHTLEVSPDYEENVTAGTWYTLQDDDAAADIALPPAGKMKSYFNLPGVAGVRLKMSTNALADRVFFITKLMGIDRI